MPASEATTLAEATAADNTAPMSDTATATKAAVPTATARKATSDLGSAISAEATAAPKALKATKGNTSSPEQSADMSETASAERSSAHNHDLGRRGEEAAVRFLQRKGFDILERNWTCLAGEVDIVALEEGVLVFIEV
ncbi:MAG: YraN family protein, partial [Coriobacteriaceae bacterium]|nr:YraN family protein [Coriobacteriaceae bacterium]